MFLYQGGQHKKKEILVADVHTAKTTPECSLLIWHIMPVLKGILSIDLGKIYKLFLKSIYFLYLYIIYIKMKSSCCVT